MKTKQTKKVQSKKLRYEKIKAMRQGKDVTKELASLWVK